MLFKKIALTLSITTGISSVSSMDMYRIRQNNPNVAPAPQAPAHPLGFGVPGMPIGAMPMGVLPPPLGGMQGPMPGAMPFGVMPPPLGGVPMPGALPPPFGALWPMGPPPFAFGQNMHNHFQFPQLPPHDRDEEIGDDASAQENIPAPLDIIHIVDLEKDLQIDETTNQSQPKKRKESEFKEKTPKKRQKLEITEVNENLAFEFLDLDSHQDESNENIILKAQGIDPNNPDQGLSKEDVKVYKACVLSRIYKGTLSLDHIHRDKKEAFNILLVLAFSNLNNKNLRIFAKALACFGHSYYGIRGPNKGNLRIYHDELLQLLSPMISKKGADVNPFYHLCYGMFIPSNAAHRDSLKEAARKGDPFAAFLTADLNEKKKSEVYKDRVEFYKIAAEGGHAQSQVTWAFMCLQNNDYKSFFKWIEMAIAKNEINALKLSKDPGFIIFKNIYKKSRQKDAASRKNLGLIFMDKKFANHILTFNGPSDFAKNIRLNYEYAQKCLRKAARAGNAEAAFHLADFYKENPYLVKNYKEAPAKITSLKQKALEGGAPQAEFNFGQKALELGDFPEAFRLICSAANKGMPQALALSQNPDFMLLKSIFEAATTNENPNALMKLGQIYMGHEAAHAALGKTDCQSFILARLPYKAIECFEGAIQYGCHGAAFYLGLIYQNEPEYQKGDLAAEMFSLAANSGHILAQNNCLEKALKTGNLKTALILYKKYKQNKEQNYEMEIDAMFEDGFEQNVDILKPEAIIGSSDFIKLMDLYASSEHDVQALIKMGKIYSGFDYDEEFLNMGGMQGVIGTIPVNVDEAINCFEIALQNNCLEAAYYLGEVYHKTDGYQNSDTAKEMYTLAASCENPQIQAKAQFMLGEIALWEGEFENAVNMYKSAAEKGDTDAVLIMKDESFQKVTLACRFDETITEQNIKKLYLFGSFYEGQVLPESIRLKIKVNMEKAILCYTKAINDILLVLKDQPPKGDGFLSNIYARLLFIYSGNTDQKDPIKAKEYLELGAGLGNAEALYILAQSYFQGNINYNIEKLTPNATPIDANDNADDFPVIATAEQLEEEAAARKKKETEAKELFEREVKAKIMSPLEKAAKLGHNNALRAVIKAHSTGTLLPGIHKNELLALKYSTMLLKLTSKSPDKAPFNSDFLNFNTFILPSIFNVQNLTYKYGDILFTAEQNEKLEKFQHISEICFVPTSFDKKILDQNINRGEIACFLEEDNLFFTMKNKDKVQIFCGAGSEDCIKEEGKVYLHHDIYKMIYDNLITLKEINRNTPAEGMKNFDAGLKAQFLHFVNYEFCSESYVPQLRNLISCIDNLSSLFLDCNIPFKFGSDIGINKKYETISNALMNMFSFMAPIYENIDKHGFYITDLHPLNTDFYARLTKEKDLFPVTKTQYLFQPVNIEENFASFLKVTEDFKDLHEKNDFCINFLNTFKDKDHDTVKMILEGIKLTTAERDMEKYNYLSAVINSAYSSKKQKDWTLKTLIEAQEYLNQQTIDFLIQMNNDLSQLLIDTAALRNSRFRLANPFLQPANQ